MGTKQQPVACTPEIFQRVIDSLHEGVTLAQLIELHKDTYDFPSLSCILTYIRTDNARKASYAAAREECADLLAEQVVVAADSTLDPQRAANRMKSRQWLAAKLRPKVYGDKLDVDLTKHVDVSIAIRAARERAQLIDHAPIFPITTTDIQSDGNTSVPQSVAPVDPFS